MGLDPKTSVGHRARQVFDLPKPQPLVVTEHRAHDCQCGACGATTRAPFPDGVNAPVQYGDRIAAFVVYLSHYQMLPENRLAALMVDLFGVKLATATIARMSRTCAERLAGFVATVRDLVAGAPVKHMDETGFRIGGSYAWSRESSVVAEFSRFSSSSSDALLPLCHFAATTHTSAGVTRRRPGRPLGCASALSGWEWNRGKRSASDWSAVGSWIVNVCRCGCSQPGK